jgi:tight adherence protein C
MHMANEMTIFSGCVFGGVAMFAYWTMRLIIRDRTEKLRERLRGSEWDPRNRFGKEKLGSLVQRVGQSAATPFMPKDKEKTSRLRRQLGYAGIYSPLAINLISGFKLILLLGGMIGGYFAGLVLGNVMLGLSLGGLAGYLMPATWIKLKVKEHQRALQQGLPDALDLFVVCIEAGLTIDAAMQRIGNELTLAHPRLARELEITHMETRVGLARSEAFRNLGQRTGSTALQALAAMLIQAERFGTSISAALRIHADTLRTQRQNAAEEMAAKASVKLSFPIVLFIFPAVLIVLAGPAAIQLFKSALFKE